MLPGHIAKFVSSSLRSMRHRQSTQRERTRDTCKASNTSCGAPLEPDHPSPPTIWRPFMATRGTFSLSLPALCWGFLRRTQCGPRLSRHIWRMLCGNFCLSTTPAWRNASRRISCRISCMLRRPSKLLQIIPNTTTSNTYRCGHAISKGTSFASSASRVQRKCCSVLSRAHKHLITLGPLPLNLPQDHRQQPFPLLKGLQSRLLIWSCTNLPAIISIQETIRKARTRLRLDKLRPRTLARNSRPVCTYFQVLAYIKSTLIALVAVPWSPLADLLRLPLRSSLPNHWRNK